MIGPHLNGILPVLVLGGKGRVTFFQPFQILLIVGIGGVEGDEGVVGQALDALCLLAELVRKKLVHAQSSAEAINDPDIVALIVTPVPTDCNPSAVGSENVTTKSLPDAFVSWTEPTVPPLFTLE